MKIWELIHFGLIMRGEEYKTLKLKFRGRIEWKIGREKPRITWTQYIRQWTCLTTVELFWIAQNREDWNVKTTDVRYMILRRREIQRSNVNTITPVFHFQMCRPCYFFEDSVTREVNLYLIFWLSECAK